MAHIQKMAEIQMKLDQEIEQENQRVLAENAEKERKRLEAEAIVLAILDEVQRIVQEKEE